MTIELTEDEVARLCVITTVDADGAELKFLDIVASVERPGCGGTIGAVYPDGTFDVCDIDTGLFRRQLPSQWRKEKK